MKPIVGVLPLWDEEKDSVWMLPGYLDGVSQAGATPVILPFSSDGEELVRLVRLCDGILFPGGQDVSPERYGEKPLPECICCEKRDALETAVLRLAMEQDKPVLGICRGIQFFNAALGGTLYQDLPLQHPSGILHSQRPPYDRPAHAVTLHRDTPLYRCLRLDRLEVNSYHHQAVKRLAPGLVAMATAPDGLIEALYMPAKRFLWAVQWHPEFSYRTDENSRKIFAAFVASMR